MKTMRKIRNGFAVAFTLILQACGCSEAACADGLFVSFNSPLVAPSKVELLVNGVVQPSANGSTCAENQVCTQRIFFFTKAEQHVSVRITSPSGTRVTDYDKIRYTGGRSSVGCESCNGAAEVVANIP